MSDDQRARDVEQERLDDFQAAIRVGMTAARAARYVRHCRLYRDRGQTPLTPEQAVTAPVALR